MNEDFFSELEEMLDFEEKIKSALAFEIQEDDSLMGISAGSEGVQIYHIQDAGKYNSSAYYCNSSTYFYTISQEGDMAEICYSRPIAETEEEFNSVLALLTNLKRECSHPGIMFSLLNPGEHYPPKLLKYIGRNLVDELKETLEPDSERSFLFYENSKAISLYRVFITMTFSKKDYLEFVNKLKDIDTMIGDYSGDRK